MTRAQSIKLVNFVYILKICVCLWLYSNMATYDPVDFELNEWVVYRKELYTLEAVHSSDLGYRTFTIKPLDGGKCITVAKYQLSKAEVKDLLFADISFEKLCTNTPETTAQASAVNVHCDLADDHTPSVPATTSTVANNTEATAVSTATSVPFQFAVDEFPTVASTTCSTEKKSAVTRHALLDDIEIDNIVKNRLSENSEKQTKWAVSLFKGKRQ